MIAVTTTSGYVTFLDYCNVAGTFIAFIANMHAAKRAFRAAKPRLYCTAFLAGFYFVAYVVLIWTPVSVEQWSNVIRGVGPLAWFVAWTWPAVSVDLLVKKVNAALHRENDADG